MKENERIIIIGAGIAGLMAAITLAEHHVPTLLISNQRSERAGSCMAEGGINAAIDSHHVGDSPRDHYKETCSNADGIADLQGIRELTEAAPQLVRWLQGIGTRFTLTDHDELEVRAFGGQKHQRTVFAGDSTGKQIMTALIDQARKLEGEGLIQRMSHHGFLGLKKHENQVTGCVIRDLFTDEVIELNGDYVIIASGGYHGLFGNTTGAKADDGEVTARLFAQGVRMSNLEFIQFHPTTIRNGNKRLLVTEAARGEGGRLCVLREGRPYYFMGGIWVDGDHATSVDGLYAAGECACRYHGANRLGGNSLLGATYGGRRAAESILRKLQDGGLVRVHAQDKIPDLTQLETSDDEKQAISEILNIACGVVREDPALLQAAEELAEYRSPFALLAQATVLGALSRKESRGAHYRSDFPAKDERYEGATVATNVGGEISIELYRYNQTTEK